MQGELDLAKVLYLPADEVVYRDSLRADYPRSVLLLQNAQLQR